MLELFRERGIFCFSLITKISFAPKWHNQHNLNTNIFIDGIAIYVEVKYKDKLYFNLNKISVMQAQSE
jgi:hypothetical protein